MMWTKASSSLLSGRCRGVRQGVALVEAVAGPEQAGQHASQPLVLERRTGQRPGSKKRLAECGPPGELLRRAVGVRAAISLEKLTPPKQPRDRFELEAGAAQALRDSLEVRLGGLAAAALPLAPGGRVDPSSACHTLLGPWTPQRRHGFTEAVDHQPR